MTPLRLGWQDDRMTKGHPNVILSSCHPLILSSCHPFILLPSLLAADLAHDQR